MKRNAQHFWVLLSVLFLAGCDVPESTTQSRNQDQERPAVTASPEPSTEATEQSSNETPAEFTAKVIDGDTIDVLTDDKETIRIRLNGIDTPERGQPFGNNAKDFVSESIGGQMVRIVTGGDDRYGRTIGDIYHDDELINLALVKAGLAWHYVKYAPDNAALREAEQQARQMNVGLWSSAHGAIAPWDWRKMSKDERDEYR